MYEYMYVYSIYMHINLLVAMDINYKGCPSGTYTELYFPCL